MIEMIKNVEFHRKTNRQEHCWLLLETILYVIIFKSKE